MKGLIIIGSAKMGSHTNALAHYLKGHFEDQYFEVEIFDLAETSNSSIGCFWRIFAK
ncbi:azoreductase [Staphylococcus cohnii]|nr:azoreductase [Staphylococcus cohnii]